jgi:AcrR family transcriptional regulator
VVTSVGVAGDTGFVSRKGLKDRRAEVLDAARRLFFAKGYRGTTIQQIAERAGYSKRTVYLDFRNKDELFMTLCAEGGELLLRKLDEIPADRLSVEVGVERILDAFVEFSRQHREYFRMIFNEATPEIVANCGADVQTSVAALERAVMMVMVRLAERAMREGSIAEGDPWDTAGMFVGTATGIVLLSMGGSQTVFSRESLERLVKKAIRTFWRGMGVGGREAGLRGQGSGRRSWKSGVRSQRSGVRR